MEGIDAFAAQFRHLICGIRVNIATVAIEVYLHNENIQRCDFRQSAQNRRGPGLKPNACPSSRLLHAPHAKQSACNCNGAADAAAADVPAGIANTLPELMGCAHSAQRGLKRAT